MSLVPDPRSNSDSERFHRSQEEESEDDYEAWRFPTCEEYVRIAKDFLRQVQENRFSEFKWPPDPNCASYKYNHISDYAGEFKMKEESEVAEKFLDQVRKSWGYDVDCIPPRWMSSSLYPIYFDCEYELLSFIDDLKIATDFVVFTINTEAEKVGKSFELVRVNKAVLAGEVLYLLTLTMEDVEAQKTITLRAAVSLCNVPELEECYLISSVPST